MRPQWYKEEDVPFKDMWPDDIYWFPYMLKEKKFEAYFKFQGMNTILDYWIKEVSNFSS